MGAQFTLGRIAEGLGATLEGDPARVNRASSVPTASGTPSTARSTGRFPRWANCATRATSRSAPTAPSTGRHSAKLGSGGAARSTTWSTWAGRPSRPVGETRRIWAAETLLPDLFRRFRALEKWVWELDGGRHA